MRPERRAVIDVGTNSIKVLLADILPDQIVPVWEESRQTRLGAGFYATHRLDAGRIQQTAHAVAEFADRARTLGATTVRVIATSAARDALNASELLEALQGASGIRAEVISGDQEAEWAFLGACSHPHFQHTAFLLLDVGGGSSEFIVGVEGERLFSSSFPLGTVRAMENVPHGDPPTKTEWKSCRAWITGMLESQVEPRLSSKLAEAKARSGDRELRLVGSGGAATLLACMELKLTRFDRVALESVGLQLSRLHEMEQDLWFMSLAQRQHVPGLPPNRADIILTGISIYCCIAEKFGFSQLQVSTRGLRFGALMQTG